MLICHSEEGKAGSSYEGTKECNSFKHLPYSYRYTNETIRVEEWRKFMIRKAVLSLVCKDCLAPDQIWQQCAILALIWIFLHMEHASGISVFSGAIQ